MKPERREHQRVNISIFLHEEAPWSQRLARSIDISENGLLYSHPTPNPPRESKEVTISFCLPDDRVSLRVLGRVVHKHQENNLQKTAIEFAGMDASDVDRIKRYISKRKRAQLFEDLRQIHLMNTSSLLH
jgi:c-di-GMP-binding flagellar brake protein YcgR